MLNKYLLNNNGSDFLKKKKLKIELKNRLIKIEKYRVIKDN